MGTFGERVKRLRLSKGMTQDQLGKASGMGQTAIGNIETGKREGSRNTAKLAVALGVDPYYLETGKGPQKPLSENAAKIAAMLDALPPDRQAILLPLIEAAIGNYVPDATVEDRMPATAPIRRR